MAEREVKEAVENLINAVRKTYSTGEEAASFSPRVESSSVSSSSRICDTLSRARSMLTASTQGGQYSRLNQRERLRAQSASAKKTTLKEKKDVVKSQETKVFDFVLIRSPEDFVDKPGQTILCSEDVIQLKGFIELSTVATEKDIRSALSKAIEKNHPFVHGDDLEFLKANRRKLMKPVTCVEYNFKLVKILAGQGSIYIKLKEGRDYLLDDEYENMSDINNDDLPPVPYFPETPTNNIPSSSNSNNIENTEIIMPETYTERTTRMASSDGIESHSDESASMDKISLINQSLKEDDLSKVIDNIVKYCTLSDISNPVEVLRVAQKCIIRGRPLEVEDAAVEIEGDTLAIMVDRFNLINTAREEITLSDDLRITLEVTFYGEAAKDFGGPRKEFFRQTLMEIKEKYFSHGLREEFSEEYMFVGIILGMSCLQNGPIPQYISEEFLQAIFSSNTPNSPCLRNLQNGLNKLAICQLCQRLPLLIHLFRPSASSILTRKKLLMLLSPSFAEEGCNETFFQKEIYNFFVKYTREAAAGRLGAVTLESILRFVTCCDSEPVLGFTIKPSVNFYEVQGNSKWMFLPQAHTCSYALDLPIRNAQIKLPTEEELFEIYNLAFLNSYFGKI